jgi:hypothetical protein
MNMLRVNLVRDRVPPPARRRRIYGVMLAYLGVCGLAIAAASYRAADLWAQGRRETVAVDRMSKAFSIVRGAQLAPGRYAAKLSADLKKVAGRVEAMDEILSSKTRPARVLLGICQPLPPSMYLAHVSIDGDRNEVTFSVGVPASHPDAGIRAKDLLDAWAKNEFLSGQVRTLSAVQSERTRDRKGLVVMHHFSAELGRERKTGGPGNLPEE